MALESAETNNVLSHGRKQYGHDGTNWRALKADTAGYIILGAGTANIGDVDVLNTETIQTELYAAASLAASTQAASTVLSLVGVKRATFFIDHGRANTVAFGTNGTEYRIEASQKASGNDTWRTVASVLCASTACLAVASSAAMSVGDTTITVTSGASIPTRGDLVMVANTASAGSTEWLKTISVSGTASFQIQDGLTNAHAAADTIFTQAEQFVITLNTEAITRARVIINNNASATTQAIRARIACITEK